MPRQALRLPSGSASRRHADKWLLGIGIFLLVAAAAGGGVKVAGGELSPIDSIVRQVILAVLGAGLVAASFFVDIGKPAAGTVAQRAEPSPDAERDREEREAPVLGSQARAFEAAPTFAVKKERFLLPLQNDIRRGRRRPSRRELEDCSRSEWDLDRVALYLAAEDSTEPVLSELLFYIEQEEERIVASDHNRSTIPIYYAVRALKSRISRELDVPRDLQAEMKEQFRALLDYLTRHPQLDGDGQVKKNLRRTLDLLEERERSPTLVPLLFEVTVPEGTDSTGKSVCLAGTLDRLAGGRPQWNPGGVVLDRDDSGRWTIELLGEPGTEIDYKYTLGEWGTVEVTSQCGEADDRSLTITPDARGTHLQRDVVRNWRGVPPCAA
jgi:hypothetical protein